MIERIILIKLKEAHASTEHRQTIASHSQKVLLGLPGVQSLSVGIPCGEKDLKKWDLSIVLRFASLDKADACLNHPEHQSYLNDYLEPRQEVIKAWNFEVQN